MASALIRLLALIALLFMPLGMGAAPALALADRHPAMLSEYGHCGEQPDQAPAQQQMDCKATCIALPAASSPVPVPPDTPTAPRTIGMAVPFTPFVPEIATPPPKIG